MTDLTLGAATSLLEVVHQCLDVSDRWHDCSEDEYNNTDLTDRRKLFIYTSPPSHKAAWDAKGNPLNLVAAAQVAYFAIRSELGPEHHACVDLLKFLKKAP